MSAKKTPKSGFEASLKRLENIVETLERGEEPLEKALDLYEEGLKLAQTCSETLKSAELKLKKISKTAGKQFELSDFETEE
ncbi:MAG: exodeoxyribonuclease VII small subunit [Proteobacteria bacterium]|nr:exodeoxyribonuclease VII small subunit [Pseudomonadota bacterium]